MDSTAEEPDLEDGLTAIEIALALGIFLIMVGVGVSCERELFIKMCKSPKALKAAAVGVACQFGIMPVVSYLLSLIFQVDGYAAFGFVLTGCMPGGSVSNMFALWGQGVLELSVFMTIISTLTAFAMTPLWLYVYTQAIGLDSALALDQIAIAFALIVIPLAIGVGINYCLPKFRKSIEWPLSIFASLVFVCVIIALGIQYSDALADANYKIYIPAAIYFPISGTLSYGVTTLLKFEPALKRTIIMELGIQNLSLGFAIGQLVTTKQSQRDLALPFPLSYAMFMYAWAALMVPVFRWQKRRNDERGIVDNDPNFFVKDDEDDESMELAEATDEPEVDKEPDSNNKSDPSV